MLVLNLKLEGLFLLSIKTSREVSVVFSSSFIGKDETIEESHIFKLPFLQAIVKKTIGLHPLGPLLIHHKCDETMNIVGINVPKNAQILINV
jgi:hypothetical protein